MKAVLSIAVAFTLCMGGAAFAQDEAPRPYKVKFECTNGDFVIKVYPEWAPLGAARFREAVEDGVYDMAAFFRVLPNFVVQFGIPGDPQKAAKWKDAKIDDEPVKESNKKGTITFAKQSIPNTRTTQVFINYADNAQLDDMGFAPFGRVIEGMEVVLDINAEYAQSPDQMQIETRGTEYLRDEFPNLDYIKKATIVEYADDEAAKEGDTK